MDVYKTFDEWSKMGFTITKGSKSTKRNDKGIPVFSKSQVHRREFPDRLPAPRDPYNPYYAKDKERKPPFRGTRYNEETGERYGYEQCFNGDEWSRVTYHRDGGKTIAGSGPCGPMYVDAYGNT